ALELDALLAAVDRAEARVVGVEVGVGAGEEPVELVEPAVERVEPLLLALVPLPDQPGRVPRGLEPVGDGLLLDREPLPGAALLHERRVELVPEPRLVAAGEQRGAGRRA